MILCDAGVLLCLVDRTQPQHKAYRTAVMGLAKPLITTWSCLTEAMYLALHRGAWQMQKQLGQLLLASILISYFIELVIKTPLKSFQFDRESSYVIIGLSRFEQLLVVAHTDRGEKIRIISARNATRQEKRFYEQGS
jgi:uncharacterized DUF497 family protein